jgi:hypothetical protein
MNMEKIIINCATLEDRLDKEEFEKFYKHRKHDGKLDSEIAEELNTNCVNLKFLKEIHDVKTIIIRKNRNGLTEEHFRKGYEIGLGRRIILRRVRDGMSIEQAISTPKNKKKINHRRKR